MSDNETVAAEDVHYTNVRDLIEKEPTFAASVREYYADKHADMLRIVGEIETFLGFLVSEDDLSVRVAKLEAFVGIKR